MTSSPDECTFHPTPVQPDAHEINRLEHINPLLDDSASKNDLTEEIHSAILEKQYDLFQYFIKKLAHDDQAQLEANAPAYLVSAARAGDLRIVTYLMETCKSAHRKRSIALVAAAENGNLAVVQYLETQGANVHDDNYGEPIKLAAKNGHFDVVKYLAKKKETSTHTKKGVLNIAAKHNHQEIVAWLVKKQGIVSLHALDEAASSGHLNIVSFLVESGAYKIHPTEEATVNAVLSACTKGHLHVLEYLMQHGASADISWLFLSPLAQAVQSNQFEIVDFLIRNGANVRRNMCVLEDACRNGNLKMVELLFANGAVCSGRYGKHALFYAASLGYLDIVRFLASHGIFWSTALSAAASNGHLDIVRFFVEECKISQADKNAAFRAAGKRGHVEICEYLQEKGANIESDAAEIFLSCATNNHLAMMQYLDQQQQLYTNAALYNWALCNACDAGHVPVAAYLLAKGADIHADDDEPLCVAIRYEKNTAIVEFLLASGANVYAQNERPFRTCMQTHNLECGKLLLACYTNERFVNLAKRNQVVASAAGFFVEDETAVTREHTRPCVLLENLSK